MKPKRFAYVFKRFPVFAQTFVVREVEGVFRHHRQPAIFSIQPPEDACRQDGFSTMEERVTLFPAKFALAARIFSHAFSGKIPCRDIFDLGWLIKENRAKREALWLGPELKSRGISRLHTHFTTEAARTAWWLHRIFGIPYSITAHANDFLCSRDTSPTLEQLVSGAHAVIAVSEFSKNWFETNFPKAKIHRVYNGMLLDDFIPLNTSNSPRILSVGRLVEKKGFSDLVKACRNLLDRGLKFSCGIVGEGPIRNQLVAMIADLGLSQHVTLYGALPQREIRKLLHQSSIFALACVKERDGGMDILPTVITEAMAAGLPVVSTRLAGIPEMVVDQVTGLLSNPGDVSALAHSLASLLTHPQTALSMGIEGRRRAEKVFNEEVTIPELLSILET